MLILAITPETWYVTCVGFCAVLVLLYAFIYIMKLLGWIMQKASAPKQDEAKVSVSSLQQEKSELQSDDAVAVAYALHLYYNSLHDEESPRLTVKNHTTAWHIIQ
ncbi:MAG: OadG family protein [Paludibacteraceae bacterium]|nr:OadG family protein [Paludibacteraceae bacterium]